ncbi:MAG: DUF3375 family protein [Methylobacter sp.]|nr:DUF3375 family protein [Methylobacter sp.]
MTCCVRATRPGVRTRRVHYDWLEAGEHTQRTVAQLSQQFRRFLDDQAWLDSRRIMDILHGIEAKALSMRESQPQGIIMSIADTAAGIELESSDNDMDEAAFKGYYGTNSVGVIIPYLLNYERPPLPNPPRRQNLRFYRRQI